MTRRRKILVCVLCGMIAVGAVCFFCLRDAEPSYNGRTLSEWLDDARGGISVTEQLGEEEAIESVNKIGTNAIPFLLRWSRATDSPIHGIMNKTAEHLSPTLRTRVTESLWRSSAELKRNHAFTGFKILRTNALAALPDLAGRFRADDNEFNALDDAMCIGQLGTNGLLVLVETIREPPSKVHFLTALTAMRFIEYLGTNAAPAVPVLVSVLKTNNTDDAWLAAAALGVLRTCPNQAIPALIEAVRSKNKRLRVIAIRALAPFGADAKLAVPDLLALLEDKDETLAKNAREALRLIAPEVLTNKSISK